MTWPTTRDEGLEGISDIKGHCHRQGGEYSISEEHMRCLGGFDWIGAWNEGSIEEWASGVLQGAGDLQHQRPSDSNCAREPNHANDTKRGSNVVSRTSARKVEFVAAPAC